MFDDSLPTIGLSARAMGNLALIRSPVKQMNLTLDIAKYCGHATLKDCTLLISKEVSLF